MAKNQRQYSRKRVRRSSSLQPSSSLESVPGPTVFEPSEVQKTKHALCVGELECRVDIIHRHVTIEMLPDDVLLEIFNFHRLAVMERLSRRGWKWHRLLHVCRQWRRVIFTSPRRLNLQLLCTYGTPVQKTLDCWPALPMVLRYTGDRGSKPPVGDVLTALQHPGRVHELTLDLTSTMVEGLATQMQEPLPALECLSLKSQDKAGSVVLPTVFLGGSAPRLRDIHLCGIAFSTLPKLLLSARDLVSLRLEKIPRTGYFPPEVLACSLSEMTELTSLHIQFLAPTSRPSQKSRRPPPLTLIVLHSLTEFKFRGISEYLEDILARINAPLLRNLEVTFFNQLIFEIPHLSQFIGRTETSQSLNQAMVYSSRSGISLILTKVRQPAGNNPVNRRFALQISCGQLDWQVSSVSQICTYFSPLLSRVERLYIRASPRSTGWPDDIEPSQWLELLDSYGSVKRLHVIGPLGPNVAPALQQVTRRMMDPPEVLPALRRLHLGGNSKSAPVDAFIARRQLCGHNITVHYGGGTRDFD